MHKKLRSMVLLLPALLFGWGVWAILQTPQAVKPQPRASTFPVVATLPAEPATHAIQIYAYGRVAPKDSVDLRPQVEGRIIRLHPAFEPGGTIEAGEELVRIENTDYRLALDAARALLEKAKARLAIEGGKRQVAKEELDLLSDSISLDKQSRSLALRTPQLREARADLLSARNTVEKAQLQLQRTRISFPRDLIVLQRDRSEGELVKAGERIGRLASASRAQIVLQMDPALLRHLHLPSQDDPGSLVFIDHQGARYQGRLSRRLQQLSEKTRQAQLLVEIDDPFNRLPGHSQRPPLLIGSYVEARIQAGKLPDSVAIPRSLLLNDRQVWVVDAGQRLRIRDIEPLFEEPDQVFVKPLPKGDRLLHGAPAGLLPGAQVRIRQSS